MTFLSMYFPFRKVQFQQSAFMYAAMATMQLFGLFLKTQIAIVFLVFPPERNFLWDSLLCFGHPNALRSLIIANIRTVTTETFQKIIFAQIRRRRWRMAVGSSPIHGRWHAVQRPLISPRLLANAR